MPTIEGCLACWAALKRFCRWQRSSCCWRSMSRRLCSGLEMTVMSPPPILAASSVFSIVVGTPPLRTAPILRWNPVPVKAGISSGGSTCTWKSMIIGPASSLDDLVGALLQQQGHFETKRHRRLEVDHQLEFGRLLDRQVARLFAAQDAVNVSRRLTVLIFDINAEESQAANCGEIAESVDRGQPILSRQLDDQPAISQHETVRGQDQSTARLPSEQRHYGLDLRRAPHLSRNPLHPELWARRLSRTRELH